MSRSIFLAVLALAVLSCSWAQAAQPANSIGRDLAVIMNRPDLRSSQFGIAFYDLDAHRMLFAYNAQKYFVAASTTKLLTEGTTLGLLGPDYRFTTNVYRTGDIDATGTLHGDIVLRASGDPNLSQRVQPDGSLAFENEDHAYNGTAVPGDPLTAMREFAKQIAAHGVKRITGRVIVDDSLFPDTSIEGGTGTVIAPVSVNDNVVDVTIGPGVNGGDPVRVSVSPQTGYVTIVNHATTGANQSASTLQFGSDVEDALGNHTLTISGSIPQGSPAKLYADAVSSPRRFAQVALSQALRDAGVALAEPLKDDPPNAMTFSSFYIPANIVATRVSPPISEDVKITLKVSDNLHAAMMPYIWGALVAHDSRDPLSAGFRLERGFFAGAGLNPLDIAQSDGEGANAYIRPFFMVRYLEYLSRQRYFDAIYRGLPVLGVDGTLAGIQTHAPAAGKVHAKTGTNGADDLLNARTMFLSAKGLAGYMTTKRGRRIAFCVYLNNFALPSGKDPSEPAGQVMGAMANAGYLDL